LIPLALILGPLAETARPEILRDRAFGTEMEVEVRGLAGAAARAALQEAFAAIRAAELAVGRPALDALSRAAPSADLLELLRRAAEFCVWSDGAAGPLGRPLYDLWGVRGRPTGIPQPHSLAAAAVSARDCAEFSRAVSLDPRPSPKPVDLAAFAARLDLWGFERGHAVDQAVKALRRAGVTNGRVRLGAVTRGLGGGPAGSGWPVVFEPFTAQGRPLPAVHLRDRALATARRGGEALAIGGESVPPYFDQRTGRPGEGKVAVLVSTETALDAEALAASLFAMPTREGEFRAGTLRPHPSLLWLLGSGDGEPLTLESRWSALRQRRP
jgi:thiamine biosynthesis lipoprotein